MRCFVRLAECFAGIETRVVPMLNDGAWAVRITGCKWSGTNLGTASLDDDAIGVLYVLQMCARCYGYRLDVSALRLTDGFGQTIAELGTFDPQRLLEMHRERASCPEPAVQMV